MKFVNINYNKEYVELIQAFIRDYKDLDLILGKAKGDLILIHPQGKEKIKIEDGIFENEKSNIKHHLYLLLKDFTQKDLSWGMLVGVNPLKLFLSLEEKYSLEEAKEILADKYQLDMDKIDLGFEIIEEQRYYRQTYQDYYSIYIDIPFCHSRCLYCSYPTLVGADESSKDMYIKTLKKEIIEISRHLKGKLACIYIGGGTPAAIGKNRLLDLVNFIDTFLDQPIEYSLELGRPDSFDTDLLRQVKNYGIGRICINPQSFNDKTLEKIGRKHTSSDVIRKFKACQDLGFESINMDLIMGLDDLSSFKAGLEEIGKFQPEELTIHGLARKKGANLKEETLDQKGFEEARDSFIKNSAYRPYYLYRQKNIYNNSENIGYTKTRPCLYNIAMMGEVHSVIGFGLASTSKFIKDGKKESYMNQRSLSGYIENIDEDIEKKLIYYKDVL